MRYAPGIVFPNVRLRGPEEEVTRPVGGAEVTLTERPDLGASTFAHVNLPEAMMVESLEAFRINPAAPQHEIFGCPTARLRFDDEAARDAALETAGYAEDDEA